MGRKAPFGDIPDRNILPEGNWTLEIESLEETATKAGALMYKGTLVTVAPSAGLTHFENFTVGTEDDPQAEDPQTWVRSIGAQRMKKMLKKAGVALRADEDMEEVCERASGARFDATVVHKTDTRDGPYKGSINANLSAIYEEGVLVSGAQPAARPQGTAQPPQRRVPSPREVAQHAGNGLDEGDEPAAPPPAQRQPPPRRPPARG